MNSRGSLARWACAVFALVLSANIATVLGQEPQELIDAARLAAAGDWDQTVETLTRLIQRVESAPRDADSGRLLIAAYERRALARLQTGDRSNAAIDFTALLQIDPNYAFVAPSPGIRTFFDDTRKGSLASLELSVQPEDAVVVLEKDGSPRADTPTSATPPSIGLQWLIAGTYRLTVRKLGYETRVEEIDARPGSSHRLPIELRRTSAVLSVRTAPSGVTVRVNGEVRGTTEAAPGGGERSQPLLIEGLIPRTEAYEVRMEKDCFVSSRIELVVPPLETWKGVAPPDFAGWDPDRVFDDVSLRPAFGTLEVIADQPGALVSIDGVRRGAAGEPITDVCHGEHAIDVRAPTGQFSQRVAIEFSQQVRVQATLVPTYGIVNLAAPGGTGAQVDRAAVVQALRAANSRLIPAELADADVASLASGTVEDVRRATDRLVQQLGTQGIATVMKVAADAQGQDVELRLFARNSSRPDVVRFSLQDGASVQRAVARLNFQIPVVKPSIGVEAVDVMRIDGAVVASVDPNGPSAGAIVPGDVIVSVGVNAIANVTDLTAAVGKSPEAPVNVRLRDKTAPVPVRIEHRPDVVSVREDRPFNIMITELNARLARQQASTSASSADERVLNQGMRLNLAVALFAVGNYSAAQEAFAEVQLENRRGISKGTVDYWRALCYKQLGRVAEARTLFEAASKAQDARLTENGPAVSYLARAELLALGAAAPK